jgi:hypothetical protein
MPSIKREDEIDKRAGDMFNNHPDLQEKENQAGMQSGDDRAFNNIADKYGDSADPTQENTNIAAAKEEQGGNWATNVSNSPGKKRSSFFGKLKKKGPAIGIGGGLIGGIFGIGVFLTPALAVVHLKEVFTEDLNDQVAAMDVRSAHVFRAKLKDLGKTGVCTGVKIRCGFRGMSDRQVKNFRKAGIEVEVGDKSKVGKNRIKSLTFTQSDGTKTTIKNPSQVRKLTIDKTVARQLKRAYNPLFYSLWDKTAGKVFTKFKTGKSSRLQGNTDEERKQSVKDSVKGETKEIESKKIGTSEDATEEEKNKAKNNNDTTTKSETSVKNSGGVKSLLGGGIRGLGVLGATDSACVVYSTARAVEAGAKVIRAAQLVGFAMVFLNFADKVKAGDATEGEANFIGNQLASIDNERKIINETSKDVDTLVDNPDYGKSAFDSEGARAAFYNDAPELTARAQQFMVGGALVGTLAKVNDQVAKILGGPQNAKKTCNIVQNPFVRGLSLGAGLALSIGSFGVGTALTVGASLAFTLALPLLEAYLKDMIAGTVVDGDTDGVDAGNAIFSGTGVLSGQMAQARGMQPASGELIGKYQQARTTVNDEYIAMGIDDAKKTPFDIMNQYSFAGMFARQLLPSYTSASSTTATLTTSVPRFFSTAFESLLPNAGAVGDFNPERFNKCKDNGYDELGIDADVFCNVRYVLTPAELDMSTDTALDWMINNGQVDEDIEADTENSEVIDGSNYLKWFEECVERQNGWGEDEDSEKQSGNGKNCIDGKSKWNSSLKYFRVYTMDKSINQGMNDGPENEGSGQNSTDEASGEGDSFRIASFNILHNGTDSHEKIWKDRLPRSINTLTSNNVDIAGLQEARPEQQKEFIKNNNAGDYGVDFDIYPKQSDDFSPNPIIWDKSKYEFVSGSAHKIKYFSATTEVNHMILVKLKGIETGEQFYVGNTHDPAGVAANKGDPVPKRKENARRYLELFKDASDEGLPMFLTGDFNSNSDGYCILTAKNSGVWNAYDASSSPPKNDTCPSKAAVGIDHIYLSKEDSITASNYKKIPDEYNGRGQKQSGSNGSDHPTIIADIDINKSVSVGASKDGWVWPVPGVKTLGILPYGARGSRGIHKGIDIGISGGAALGREVVAAHSGIVNWVDDSASACGAYISITATGTDYYAAYQHVDASSIKVRKGDTVSAGDPIAKIGRQGGSTCGSNAFYHLHFSIEGRPASVSQYADDFPNGTIDPLLVLPR